MPEDIDAYRRQLAFRCGHIGTKELEIVLRDYLTLNMHKMTRAQLEKFDYDILNMENPSLQRYLLNGEPVKPEDANNEYLHILIDYIHARKTDYASNVPKVQV